jgi:hypothetical protein
MALLELVDVAREAGRADGAEPAPAPSGTGPAGLGGLVRRASDLAEPAAGTGPDRLLPVAAELRALLPGGGLRRGGTAAVLAGSGPDGSGSAAGSTSLLLALLAEASAGGAWIAAVGMPGLGPVAAAQAGIALSRLALIPCPGPEWTTVVAALLDGVDVVVVAPPGAVPARVASRLAARARQRGGVLVSYGRWEGADVTLSVEHGQWEGLGSGHGRLRRRHLVISAHGRGAAGRPRRVQVLLPDPEGRLAPAAGSATGTHLAPAARTAPAARPARAAPAAGSPRRAA